MVGRGGGRVVRPLLGDGCAGVSVGALAVGEKIVFRSLFLPFGVLKIAKSRCFDALCNIFFVEMASVSDFLLIFAENCARTSYLWNASIIIYG